MAILKYRSEGDDSRWEWEEVLSMEMPGNILGEADARERIDRLGLMPVHVAVWGIVYDKADAPFREILKRHYNCQK